ncbi:MAG: biotin--[acetyl-CoA-carboxylase] ligase [Gemmatimonadales bacterium]
MSPTELAKRIQAPNCVSLAKVTSTLDIIHELAFEGAPRGTVVIADEQVAGRGRLGRNWRSPPKIGIWLGYLVRPRARIGSGVLSIRVGLTLVQVLKDLNAEVFLKWPNDLMVRDRKIAGVLCEARWLRDGLQWVGVGIGINVYSGLPTEISHRAAALDRVLPGITRIDVLGRLVPGLHTMSEAELLTTEELEAFEQSDWLRDRAIKAPVTGIARGIDRSGGLRVETRSGIEQIFGGSVVAA